eukprot:7999059-Heterocapsa_arctica.AAC.1
MEADYAGIPARCGECVRAPRAGARGRAARGDGPAKPDGPTERGHGALRVDLALHWQEEGDGPAAH